VQHLALVSLYVRAKNISSGFDFRPQEPLTSFKRALFSRIPMSTTVIVGIVVNATFRI